MSKNRSKRVERMREKFIEFYENPTLPYFTYNEELSNLSGTEWTHFLEDIDLSRLLNTIPSLYVSTAITCDTTYNFGIYLLCYFPYEIEVNEPDSEGRTLFQTIVSLRNDLNIISLKSCLAELYFRGYTNKAGDFEFLAKAYKEDANSSKKLESWGLCRLAFLIQDGPQLRIAFRRPKILFTILSFKLNRPIGIQYPNLLAVANSALQHYQEVGDLILRAMKHYKVYEDIVNRDKKGNFKLKLEDYLKHKPLQDHEYDEVIYKVFPELKPDTNAIANQPQ